MQTYDEPARTLPALGPYDVVVAGGGCAGLAAGIASASTGARTLLIERFPYLGGTATASLMANINGFRNQVEPDSVQTVRGIAEEVIRGLDRLGGLGRSPYPQKDYDLHAGELAYSYAIDTEKFKYLTLKMAVDAGVELLFHTLVCDAIVQDHTVGGLVVENKSGRQAILARVVVDASGDADVAARAGGAFWQTRGDEAPRLTDSLMYRIGGVAAETDLHGCPSGNGVVVWGPSAQAIDATDARQLTDAEIAVRLQVYDHFERLRRDRTGLEEAYIAETPPLLGVRQTRFVEGEYKLTADDALEGRRFDDAVAISSCPIIHYYGYRRYLEHEGFDIPYRCLVPRELDGLLVAGRCISSEQQPYESYRAMAPILAIGQAAGEAAALAAETGRQPRGIDVDVLRRRLVAAGAELRWRPG